MSNLNKIIVDFILIVVVATIGINLFFAIDTDGTAAVAATGSLTFTGNVTTGEMVNITNSGTTYTFQFNTTGNGTTNPSYIPVNVSNGYNTSIRASGNLTTAINNNATVAAFVTAVNTTNTTTLTADTTGTSGNSIGTTETLAQASWAAGTLTGGTAAITAWDLLTVVIWGFIVLIAVAGLVLQLLVDMGINLRI